MGRVRTGSLCMLSPLVNSEHLRRTWIFQRLCIWEDMSKIYLIRFSLQRVHTYCMMDACGEQWAPVSLCSSVKNSPDPRTSLSWRSRYVSYGNTFIRLYEDEHKQIVCGQKAGFHISWWWINIWDEVTRQLTVLHSRQQRGSRHRFTGALSRRRRDAHGAASVRGERRPS